MATERVLSNLNLISFKTESGLQNHIDELQEGDLAFTPDNSLKGILLDFKWADHLLNDISWLRADTFSWHDGDVYVAAYNHLVADFENAEVNHWYAWAEIGGGIWYTKTPTVAVGDTVYNDDFSVYGQVETASSSGTNFSIGANDFNRSASNDITVGDIETIGDIEITYYRAEDGHKICLPDQEDKVLALYNATGVAWYYILDTANKQFKLPRTKFGFTGLRDEVGGYVEPSLPDHTHDISFYSNFGWNGVARIGSSDRANDQQLWEFTSTPASESNNIYKDGETVQPPATQMYLYFYVGNFERDALEQTAGVTTETLNKKLDVDAGNVTLEGKSTIVGWGMPDYSAGVSASSTNTIAQTDIYVKSDTQTSANSQIYINDVVVASGWESFVCAYVPKGSTFRVTGANAVYYPLKGVN